MSGGHFTQVYDWLWRHADLAPEPKLLYSRLWRRCKNGEIVAYADETWMAQQLGVKPRRVREMVAVLRAYGLVERIGKRQLVLPQHPWMDKHDGGFTKMPDWLLARPGLTARSKMLYARLARMADSGNDVKPHQDWLARELHADERTIRRCVEALVTAELLSVERRGNQLANVYAVLEPALDVRSVAVIPASDVRSYRHSMSGRTGSGCPVQRGEVQGDVPAEEPPVAAAAATRTEELGQPAGRASANEEDGMAMRRVEPDDNGFDDEAPAFGAGPKTIRAASKPPVDRPKGRNTYKIAMRLQHLLQTNEQDMPSSLRVVSLKPLAANLKRRIADTGATYEQLAAAVELFGKNPLTYAGQRRSDGWKAFERALPVLLEHTRGSFSDRDRKDYYAEDSPLHKIDPKYTRTKTYANQGTTS